MSGTAMLDVLTNAIGAMLALAFLFLTLVGFPPPDTIPEDLENPKVRIFALEASISIPPSSISAMPQVFGPVFYRCDGGGDACMRNQPRRVKSTASVIADLGSPLPAQHAQAATHLTFVGLEDPDSQSVTTPSNARRGSILFEANPNPGCTTVYSLLRSLDGTGSLDPFSIPISVSTWAGMLPPIHPPGRGRIEYYWREEGDLTRSPTHRPDQFIAPGAYRELLEFDAYQVVMGEEGQEEWARGRCLTPQAIREAGR
jgi:hypothetical protein